MVNIHNFHIQKMIVARLGQTKGSYKSSILLLIQTKSVRLERLEAQEKLCNLFPKHSLISNQTQILSKLYSLYFS